MHVLHRCRTEGFNTKTQAAPSSMEQRFCRVSPETSSCDETNLQRVPEFGSYATVGVTPLTP